MIKAIIGGIIGLIVIVGGILYLEKSESPAPERQTVVSDSPEMPRQPWIEVNNPPVFELKNRKTKKLELKTGDKISAGAVIETSANGLAAIHFQNGSVARIDSKTSIVVDEAEYNLKSKKLSIKISLISGRVWSKVIELLTLDSQWQVKTTNAVATVRGTAFGSEFKDGRSSFIGSQNVVSVNLIDPKTKKIIENKVVLIDPEKFVAVEDKKIDDIQKGKIKFETQPITETLKQEEWIDRSEKEDVKLDENIQQLKEQGFQAEEIQSELEKTITGGTITPVDLPPTDSKTEDVGNKLEQIPRPSKTEIINLKNEDTEDNESSDSVKTASSVSLSDSSESSTQAIIKTHPLSSPLKSEESILILTNDDLQNVIEGKLLTFRAIMTSSSGEKRDVTTEVEWKTVGQTGNFVRPGIFMPKLSEEASEFGEAYGAVAASWKNIRTGAVIVGSSPVFKVGAKVEENTSELLG